MNLDLVKDTSIGHSEDGFQIVIEMEYLPNLSKNRYKTRNGFIKRDVKEWREQLAWTIHGLITSQNMEFKPPIKVKIDGEFSGGGRMPDIQNFVDIIADSIEDGLGINDNQFRIETGLAKRSLDAKLIIDIRSEG